MGMITVYEAYEADNILELRELNALIMTCIGMEGKMPRLIYVDGDSFQALTKQLVAMNYPHDKTTYDSILVTEFKFRGVTIRVKP